MVSNKNIENYIEQIEDLITDLSHKLDALKAELKRTSGEIQEERQIEEDTSASDVMFIPKATTSQVEKPTMANGIKKEVVNPLREYISMFDYFYFRRELFLDSESLIESELETLTHLPDFSSATKHLEANYPWVKTDEPAAKAFLEIVERYYA